MLSFVVLILTRLLGFGGERGKYNTYFIFYIYLKTKIQQFGNPKTTRMKKMKKKEDEEKQRKIM